MSALSARWNQFKTSAENFWNDKIKTQLFDNKIKPFANLIKTQAENFWNNKIKTQLFNGRIKPFYQKHQAVLSWQNAVIIISGVALAALILVAAVFVLPLEFLPFVALGSMGVLVIAGLIAKRRLEGLYSKEAWPFLSQLRQKIHESTANNVKVDEIVPLMTQLDGKTHPKFSHLKHQIQEIQKKIDEFNRLLTTQGTQAQAIQSYKTALIQAVEELLRQCDPSKAIPVLV